MSYRVGLNAQLLSLANSYRGAGINGYIFQLLRHLPTVDHSLVYTAYYYDPAFRVPPGITGFRAHWDTRSPWRRILWEQSWLAALSGRENLLHGLAYASPLFAACRTIVTIHDLSFLRFPAAFRPFNRVYLRLITLAATQRAARVITVSESTRQDVIRLCGVAGTKVVTVPNGVTEGYSPAAPAEVAEFRRRHGLPERFILFLGTLEPRKNLARLIDAYADWRRMSREDVKLVVAGGKGWYYQQIFARAAERGVTGDVIFPGFIPGEELVWWYRAASLFVYPSLFEGFGLPVLEAMACGTPVITSTTSSLPEVAGDAALMIEPTDTAALTAAIDRVLANPGYADQLRARGLRQAGQFSWAATASATSHLYHTTLEVECEE